jgi:exosortase A
MGQQTPTAQPDGSPVAFGGVVVVLGATIAAYWPTVASLLRFWNDYDNLSYTHGYLIAAISGWLLWRARHRIVARMQAFSLAGLAALALCSVAWSVTFLAGIEVGHQALLPFLLLAAVAAFAGPRAAAACALPVGYLYFAIPIWDQINGTLQQLTIFAVTLLLKLFAIPAWIDGAFVHLGSGSFEIAGGCAGLHFFIVALAIGVLFGELGHDSPRTRIKLVLIAGAMAIVMNWIRVASIIIAGYLTDMQSYLVKVDHYYFGWALFGVLLFIYFWGVPRMLHLQANAPPPVPPRHAAKVPLSRAMVACAATALVAAFAPVLVLRSQAAAASAATSVELMAPKAVGWEGPYAPQSSWNPDFRTADKVSRASWLREGARVESFTAMYAYQEQGKEMVGFGNSLLGSDGSWKTLSKDTLPATGRAAALNRVVAQDSAGATWVFLYRYDVGGKAFAGGFASKLYYPIALVGGSPASSLLAAAARCGDDCESATRLVASFMDSIERKVAQ